MVKIAADILNNRKDMKVEIQELKSKE